MKKLLLIICSIHFVSCFNSDSSNINKQPENSTAVVPKSEMKTVTEILGVYGHVEFYHNHDTLTLTLFDSEGALKDRVQVQSVYRFDNKYFDSFIEIVYEAVPNGTLVRRILFDTRKQKIIPVYHGDIRFGSGGPEYDEQSGEYLYDVKEYVSENIDIPIGVGQNENAILTCLIAKFKETEDGKIYDWETQQDNHRLQRDSLSNVYCTELSSAYNFLLKLEGDKTLKLPVISGIELPRVFWNNQWYEIRQEGAFSLMR